MRVALHTLGCKVNQYDAQSMAQSLSSMGHQIVSFLSKADVYILNTCTVTSESERKARQIVSRIKREHPESLLLVCGCWAQRSAQHVLAIDGVDAVMGTTARQHVGQVLVRLQKGNKQNFVESFTPLIEYEEGCGAQFERARAHVKIQDGCDRHCTYCIIPKARGPVRSRTIPGIRAECEQAAQAGHHEIVLTGIRLTSFGREQGGSLMDAVEAAAATSIGRIRLGSLDPDDIGEDFIRRAADCEKLCRHFHLSLQSGSDSVLRRMGRRYTALQFAAIVQSIRDAMPEATFTTDVMCGFVGETQQEHLASCRFIRDIGFMRLHVFPYSKREGTAAENMPGHLAQAVKQQRTREMIEIGNELESAYAKSQMGQRAEIVWEQRCKGGIEGHARSYLRIRGEESGRREGMVECAVLIGSQGPVALV